MFNTPIRNELFGSTEVNDTYSKRNISGLTLFIRKYLANKLGTSVDNVTLSEKFVLSEVRNQEKEFNIINFNYTPLHVNDSLVTLKGQNDYGLANHVDVTKYLHKKTAGAIISRFLITSGYMEEWQRYDPRGKAHTCIPYNPIDVGALKIRNRREHDTYMEFVGPGA
jgi:hypothetical protein